MKKFPTNTEMLGMLRAEHSTELSRRCLADDELDKSMKKFQTKNADFFGEYTNARMIIDLGKRHEKKPETPKPNP